MMSWYQYSEEAAEINRCKKKIAEEKQKISDSEFNIKLYVDYMVSKIRNMIPVLSENVLHTVWINMQKDEKDEKFKGYYKYVNDVIKDFIIGDTECSYKKTKLVTEIISQGYSSYGYSLSFIVDEIKFVFDVPVPNHINSENYLYAHEGMYRLGYYETEYCDTLINCSYNLKDLQKAFKDFIEKRKEN